MNIVTTHDPEEFERRLEAVLERFRQIFNEQDRREDERKKRERDAEKTPRN